MASAIVSFSCFRFHARVCSRTSLRTQTQQSSDTGVGRNARGRPGSADAPGTQTLPHARAHTQSVHLNYFLKALFDQGIILIPMSLFTPGAAACRYYRIHPWPTRKYHTTCSCTTFAMPTVLFFARAARSKIRKRSRGSGSYRTIEPRVCEQPLILIQCVTFAAASSTSGGCTLPVRYGPRTACSR